MWGLVNPRKYCTFAWHYPLFQIGSTWKKKRKNYGSYQPCECLYILGVTLRIYFLRWKVHIINYLKWPFSSTQYILPSPKTFASPEKKIPTHWAVTLVSHSYLATTNLPSAYQQLAYLVYIFHVSVIIQCTTFVPDFFHQVQRSRGLSTCGMYHYFIPICDSIFACVHVCVYHLFTHSSIDEHLSCFHSFAIINSAATNVPEQALVWTPIVNSSG